MSKVNNLIDEYFDYQEKYKCQYGGETLVLMQVGSFFEAYQTLSDGYDLSKISSMLNVILSRKNKSIATIDRKNPYMLGFPVPVISKYMKVLMENGFTIILIEQITPPPNPKREVTGIYSPATYMESSTETTCTDNKYILSIFIEECPALKTKKQLMSVGLSILDLSTGKSMVHEMYSNSHDDKLALDEAVKFIHSYSIKEIIITTHKLVSLSETDVINYLELSGKTYHYKTLDMLQKEPGNKLLTNISFQDELIKKIFNCKIEDLNLGQGAGLHERLSYGQGAGLHERLSYGQGAGLHEHGRNAFVILLKYAIDHNRNIVTKLERPEMYSDNKYLHIGNNACMQLNIFGETGMGSIKSLFDVINKTSTPMGRRYLKTALVQPLTDSEQLDERYNIISHLLSDKRYVQYDDILKEIGDIERLERKMKINSLHPIEMYAWIKYQKNIVKLLQLFDVPFFDYDIPKLLTAQKDMLQELDNKLEYEQLNNHLINDITSNIFKEGVHPELDEIQYEIDVCNHFMDRLADKLNELLDKEKETVIKVESNERDGHYLALTKRRADILEKELGKISELEIRIGKTKPCEQGASTERVRLPCEQGACAERVRLPCEQGACAERVHKVKPSKLIFKHATGKAGYTKIFLPELDKNSDKVIALTMKLKSKVKHYYEKFVEKLVEDYGDIMYKITNIVALMDFFKSGAKVADMYRYTRPVIQASSKSFIETKELRHPIVERINTETEYVPVDITLGVDDQDGILLFGLNSAGKSTLQKAIGISVIMAQIGYYVPAKSYTYNPYHSLFTRISGNDNLFKGLSSFTLELVELQAILKRSGENTLVIADEIASGTEHQSALIIVMTMIHILSQSRTSFITATHLHELCDMDVWQDIKNVQMYHLHVEFDEENHVLVYDRRLKPGHGSSFYGLEVAKYLIDDRLFLDTSTEISRKVGVYTFVSDKTSRYNKKVLMDKCAVCKHVPKKGEIPLETHHIEFQKDTDKDGFLIKKPHKHKNHKSNLVVLCHKCHDKIDTKELRLEGYKETSKGLKLINASC